MKNFISSETEIKFKQQLNSYPESWHPNDYERFYDFIVSLFQNKDSIDTQDLLNAIQEFKNWKNKEFIERFIDIAIDKINELERFYNNLDKKNLINAT